MDVMAGEDNNPDLLTIQCDGDLARVIYFALCNERDKVVADITTLGREHLENLYDRLCGIHDVHDPFCRDCQFDRTQREKGHQIEKNRDEEALFLGEYLSRIGQLLFEMGENNKEVSDFLSV